MDESLLAQRHEKVFMALVWERTYETGNLRIDGQHKKLFELTNRLEGMLHGAEALDPGPVLQYLDTYINIHFCYEELCMSMAKCPMHEANRTAHGKFMALFEAMQARFSKEGPSREFVQSLYDAIAEWIVQHICKIDMSMKGLVRN